MTPGAREMLGSRYKSTLGSGRGHRAIDEVFDRRPFLIALARSFDPKAVKVTPRGVNEPPLLELIGVPEVTLKQAALISFKVRLQNCIDAYTHCLSVRS